VNSIWNRDSVATKIVSQDRFFVFESYGRSPCSMYRVHSKMKQKILFMYEGWNFNSGNYLFTTDTK